MARFSRLDYVILYASELEDSIRFYRDVIGLEFRFSENGYAEFATGSTKFGLYEAARVRGLIGSPPASSDGPACEVALIVDDVDAEAIRLRAAGATILAEPTDRPWGHRTLHVADPDGNVVEFAQEIPRASPR